MTVSDAPSATSLKTGAHPNVAVLIPCHNEALTIDRVVADFRKVLPAATVYVYDNRSSDDTIHVAKRVGAVVREEHWQGKGNVVRRMFSDVDADVYLLVDGDATYDSTAAPRMIDLLLSDRLDMVVAARRNIYDNAHRFGHGLGNRLFNGFFQRIFSSDLTDIFSGYRCFSRRFVKSFPAVSRGFEIETEMSIHASQLRLPVSEIEADYGARPNGSVSKLSTIRDSLRILSMMIVLYKEVRPANFFGFIAVSLFFAAVLLGFPVLENFLRTGLVPRFPTAILTMIFMVLAAISLTCGLILDSVARGRLEQKRFAYLAQGSPWGATYSDRWNHD